MSSNRTIPTRYRKDNQEGGFSLIELMIVLLIVAILLAVAIPTYLSARNRAENRAAQETLTHASTFAMSEYIKGGSWPSGQIFQASFNANIGVIQNGGGMLGTSAIGALPPGTPLDDLLREFHGNQWVELQNSTTGGMCFGLLDVESRGSAALTGTATSANSGQTVTLGAVPSPGTWFAAQKQQSGSCPDGALASGWKSSWAAATAAA